MVPVCVSVSFNEGQYYVSATYVYDHSRDSNGNWVVHVSGNCGLIRAVSDPDLRKAVEKVSSTLVLEYELQEMLSKLYERVTSTIGDPRSYGCAVSGTEPDSAEDLRSPAKVEGA